MTRFVVHNSTPTAVRRVKLADYDITDAGWLTGVTQSGERRVWSPGSSVYVREIGEVSDDE